MPVTAVSLQARLEVLLMLRQPIVDVHSVDGEEGVLIDAEGAALGGVLLIRVDLANGADRVAV